MKALHMKGGGEDVRLSAVFGVHCDNLPLKSLQKIIMDKMVVMISVVALGWAEGFSWLETSYPKRR